MTRLKQFNNDEFKKGTFVVDPPGCGCTDCLMGYSTPDDELNQDAVMAAMILGFEVIDRRHDDRAIRNIGGFTTSNATVNVQTGVTSDRVSLEVLDGDMAKAHMTPKQARSLARLLAEAAASIEAKGR